VETAFRQEISAFNFPYRQIGEELIKFLVFANSVVPIFEALVCSVDDHLNFAEQSSATQVWKKGDAGLKSSLRRPTLDSLFWKAKKRIKNQPAAFGAEVGERKN